MRLSYWALPLLLKVRLRPWLPAGIQTVTVQNAETLARLFQQFQCKQIRLLIAFRHVEVEDPLCMGHMFAKVVPKIAQQNDIPLKGPIHSQFMYDRGMSLWAGAWLKSFFAWMGGIPVRRGARDLKAIKTARDVLINGQFPLTIAPEGATNGHSELLSPLEPGVAQLAFWGVQDLRRQQRQEEVIVLPVSIRYRYVNPDWDKLDRLLTELETDSGLTVQACPQTSMGPDVNHYYQRLLNIGVQMLSYTEQVYRQFYHVPLGAGAQRGIGAGGRGSGGAEGNRAIAQQLQPLLDEMLKVGERYFGLSSEGNLPTRCRRLEEAGWSRIYRDDLNLASPKTNRADTNRADANRADANRADANEERASHRVSAMARGFADRLAAESLLQMEHMRLVESMVAVTGHYVKDKPSFERFAETALLLFDVMQRIKGVKAPARPRLGWRQVCITIGQPVSATDRWSGYQQDRKATKDALTDDIRQQLEQLITQAESAFT